MCGRAHRPYIGLDVSQASVRSLHRRILVLPTFWAVLVVGWFTPAFADRSVSVTVTVPQPGPAPDPLATTGLTMQHLIVTALAVLGVGVAFHLAGARADGRS